MDMKRTATALGCVAAGLLALPAMAAPISIVNPGFEAQLLGENADTNNNVTGWTDNVPCSPNCFGVFNPGVGNIALPSGNVAEGKNAAYLVSPQGHPLFQTLSATLAANTIYTLTVAVGNPVDRPDTGSFGFELGLVGSANKVLAYSALTNTTPNGSFVDLSVSATVLAGNPDIGKTLVIRLFGPAALGRGVPITHFDNVRLDAVSTAAPIPEPETYAMMLAGLGLLGFAARRRKQRTA